ncbi:DUF1800 domain-containing protein [Alteromonas sp. ASW11-36]|uniref:DUF1800 domain-containing protein n=1 Tax=Alteromonas arenosi TaxID=3055817 RepID=A0ABT7SWT2_9ALTE|nr:DUF1800 domain-containing protein [Alteromonas sp. ASW11-36]MDM7860647.1 DUF1800 domain-containing protein [Alteromonas sp. ASW11-36]
MLKALNVTSLRLITALFACLLLSACGGGGDSTNDNPPPTPQPVPTTPTPSPAPTEVGKFATPQTTSRFLTMATFGPTPSDVELLTGTSASEWILEQFSQPVTPFLSSVQDYYEMGEPPSGMLADAFDQAATTYTFWRNAVHGDDQLRQRMAFALSQITVVSNGGGGLLGIFPQTLGYYQDILAEHALGNYRDLLEAITYSPAMAEYLTYLGNQKGDPTTGRVPDENYARELLQLFTIGLVALNPDGTPMVDATGNSIEVYDNEDITELAKVFTGLDSPRLDMQQNLAARIAQITEAVTQPLSIDPDKHSTDAKSFLNFTIAANTSGAESISLALDHIMAHPNVGPFIGRQLIQRFVTSNPRPEYVERVANAFDQGLYKLPNGIEVGDGRKGDLKATIAAILFDPDIDETIAFTTDEFGKVREPILRLTHFMRAFETDMSRPEYIGQLYDTSPLSVLGQHPYRSPSVFNFYRPGYVASGTLSAQAGLVAPELQIVNASSIPGYINLLSFGSFQAQRDSYGQLRQIFARYNVEFDDSQAQQTFVADYSSVLELADDSTALIDYLDNLLLYGSLSDSTRLQLIATLDEFPQDSLQDNDARLTLIGYAVLMIMSSPDYLVQR